MEEESWNTKAGREESRIKELAGGSWKRKDDRGNLKRKAGRGKLKERRWNMEAGSG
jgi:hypothetical protein